MYLKVHAGASGEVVAICDSELLGLRLTEGALVLDLERHRDFYQGERVSMEQAVDALKGAANANLVGKKALQAAASAGLEASGQVMISGVPHLQVYRI